MTRIGIVEGFFGPEWSREARFHLPAFLQQSGGSFYIYAPKRDAFLRKNWRDKWPSEYIQGIITLRDAFQTEGIQFGMGFSPFGLGEKPTSEDLKILDDRLKLLSGLNLDMLGLFFDDMPSTPNLLDVQSDVVHRAMDHFPRGLIFCPSYYSFDPILDKVFGQRPEGYMEGLALKIPKEVDICWTGPKVISEEISSSHLNDVRTLLGRDPFIWENLFANDGPKNCKFLKLKNFDGRDSSLLSACSGIALNLMNQPYLSQVLFLSSVLVLKDRLSPAVAFEKSCDILLTESMSEFLKNNRSIFLESGLDLISSEQKNSILNELDGYYDAAAFEIAAWIRGEYLVGPECLTD